MQIHRNRCILSDVMASDLIVLGRQLTRIGETVMRGQAAPAQPTIAGMVLAESSLTPAVESFPDPADRRRTLVRVSTQHPGNVMRAALVRADDALTTALGDISPSEAADIIKTLEALAARLRPGQPGPILDQLNRARDERSRD
jgi:hypothetical protein